MMMPDTRRAYRCLAPERGETRGAPALRSPLPPALLPAQAPAPARALAAGDACAPGLPEGGGGVARAIMERAAQRARERRFSARPRNAAAGRAEALEIAALQALETLRGAEERSREALRARAGAAALAAAAALTGAAAATDPLGPVERAALEEACAAIGRAAALGAADAALEEAEALELAAASVAAGAWEDIAELEAGTGRARAAGTRPAGAGRQG